MDQDNNQEIIEGISSSMSKKIEYNQNVAVTKHPKILLQHFFVYFLDTAYLFQENIRKSAPKVFFGCLVANRSLSFGRLAY